MTFTFITFTDQRTLKSRLDLAEQMNCIKVGECENLKEGKYCPHSAAQEAVFQAVRRCAPAPDKRAPIGGAAGDFMAAGKK